MIKYISILFLGLLSTPFSFCQISVQTIENQASFRAVHYFADHNIWVSGSKGSILLSTDLGKTWQNKCSEEYEKFDFRGIAVLDKNTVLAISAGDAAEGKAFVLKTENGGKNWNKILELTDKGLFLDCIKFANNRVGYILSDPLDAKPYLLKTVDAGKTWNRIDKSKFVDLWVGDASFAASNSCISLYKNHVWFNTQNRIYHSANGGDTWEILNTPFEKSSSKGIFGMKFIDASNAFLVGGDYQSKTDTTLQFCSTSNGGKSWQKSQSIYEVGLTEGIAQTQNKTIIKASLQGAFIYKNKGWKPLDKTPFHAIDCQNNTCILVGGKGKIGVVKIP